MPKRILIIGILFCFGGVLAIWEVVRDVFQSHVNLNFAVLMLPVGIGILKGKKRSQWWGRGWVILGYIGCGLLAGACAISPENLTVNWFDKTIQGTDAIPSVLFGLAFVTVGLVTIHRLLYSEKAKDYFNQKSEPSGDINSVRPTHFVDTP